MDRVNVHATVVVVGHAGILIEGASGTGKSTLALHLLERSRARGGHAALVADDRVWLSVRGGRLVAEVPDAIAGMIEIRGIGPVACPGWIRCAVVDRAVRLVPAADAPRLAEPASVELAGMTLPRLDLAERDATGAARAIEAWAGWPPDG